MLKEDSEQAQKLSRRNFLKWASGAALGGILSTHTNGEGFKQMSKWFLAPQLKPDKPHPAPVQDNTQLKQDTYTDLVFSGECHVYDGKAARIIEQVKKIFGISIISPLRWGEKDELNLPYNARDIASIADAILSLPPEYLTSNRSPHEILLLRSPGSISEGAGGGYNGRRIIIYTSENFNADEKMHGQAGKLYGTGKDHLKATVIHEYTHSFTEATQGLLDLWNSQTGWIQKPDGSWNNSDPRTLIHDGGADKNPGEDIAVSTGLMLVNPESLSHTRRNFFLTNPHYASWSVITPHRDIHL